MVTKRITYKNYEQQNFSSKYTLHFDTDEDWIKRSAGEILNSGDFMLNSSRHDTSVTAGLYDIKIFGSVDKCYCGKIKTEGFCPYCKTKVHSRENYEKQFAHYQLKYPYSFSNTLKILVRLIQETVGIQLVDFKIDSASTKEELLIKHIWSLEFTLEPLSEYSKYFKEDPHFYTEHFDVYKVFDSNDSKYKALKISYITKKSNLDNIGLIGLKNISHITYRDQSLNFVRNYINSIYIISSPASRPPRFTKQNGKVLAVLPTIHNTYKMIIECDKLLRNGLETSKISSIDKATLLCLINILIERLTKNGDLLKPSKQSLLRNLPGVRLDLTMRANISPNNNLALNEIGVPKSAVYLALQHQIISILREDKDDKIALNAEYYYFKVDKKAEDIMYKIIEDSCALFARSPLLFKYGVMAFKIVLIEENKPVFQLNPVIAEPFNADFDGDQMLVMLETDKHNARKYLQKMSPGKLWFYDKGDPLFVPSHEQLVGLVYASNIMATKKKSPVKYRNFEQVEEDIATNKIEIDEEIYINGKRTSYGRYRLDKILGTSLDDIIGENEIINSKNIAKIISGLGKKKDKLEIVNQMIQISDEFATKIGIDTPPRMNLYKAIDPKIAEILEDKSLSEEQKYVKINKVIEETLSEQIKKLPRTNFELIAQSSGRVNMQQLRGLYARRVYMENGNCVVADSEIMSGLIEKDLYSSAYEAREVFVVKKAGVPIGGYGQRQVSVLLNNLKYTPQKSPYDNKGIKVPISCVRFFEGRDIVKQDSNFIYYNSMVARPFDDKIYSNEIRKDLFIYQDEDGRDIEQNLGSSLGLQLLESIVQGTLKLKYGADLEFIEPESVKAIANGVIKDITSDSLILEDTDGKEWRYILTLVSQIASGINIGAEVKEGDVLINSSVVKKIKDSYNPMAELLGFQVAGGMDKTEIKTLSYATENNSLITYKGKFMTCGPIRQSINQKLIYKYPDGWRINYADRFSSGILDMKKLLTYGKPEDIFFIFYKEFHDVYSKRNGWGKPFHPEFLEPLYSVISRTDKMSIQSATRERTDLIDSMYGGSPKQAFRKGLSEAKVDSKTKSKIDYDMTYISELLLRLNN